MLKVALRVESGQYGPLEACKELARIAAFADLPACGVRFSAIQDHQVVSTAGCGLGRCRACLFVPELAVDDRREAVGGITSYVFPDVEHRPARGVNERAALLLELVQQFDRDPECREN